MVPLCHSRQHAGMDERPGGGRTRPERAWTRCRNPPVTCMLGLSKDRELRSQWQRACELLLAEADVDVFSRQVELALFYDAKLVLNVVEH
jgi:hypothetical protein